MTDRYTLLISLAGIRFDRGMGEYIKHYLPYLCEEFRNRLLIVSNTSIPQELHEIIINNKSKLIKVNLTSPILEQFVVPAIIKHENVRLAYFPANTFPIIKPNNVKYVVTIHDLIFLMKDYNPKILKQKLGKFYRAFILKQGINKIDTIITVSYKTLHDIIKYFKLRNVNLDDSNVVYNPIKLIQEDKIDNSILRSLNLKPAEFFYTISGTADNKNLEFCLKAFANLKRIFPNFKLVISGIFSPHDQQKYNSILKSLSIKNSVIFTPYIPEEQKRSLLRNCKAFLFLSKEEGFGRPIIEALLENSIVIASDIEIFREIGGEFIYYVKIDDENCLVNFYINYKPKKIKYEAILTYLKSKFDINVLSNKLIAKIYETMGVK